MDIGCYVSMFMVRARSHNFCLETPAFLPAAILPASRDDILLRTE